MHTDTCERSRTRARLPQLYPHLKLPGEPELAASPVEFRLQALDRLEADAGYMSLVDAMLRLWLSLDASVLASSVEDFYTLPSTFQEQFMAANKQAHATGTESLDVAALCKAYVNMMREVHEVGEGSTRRPSYVPLGEIELSALCDLYKVRLQAIKSEDITVSTKHGKKGSSNQDVKGPTLDTIDPRCVRPEHVLDRFAPKDAKRYVRVLNVDTNRTCSHTRVVLVPSSHVACARRLPSAPPTSTSHRPVARASTYIAVHKHSRVFVCAAASAGTLVYHHCTPHCLTALLCFSTVLHGRHVGGVYRTHIRTARASPLVVQRARAPSLGSTTHRRAWCGTLQHSARHAQVSGRQHTHATKSQANVPHVLAVGQ